MTLAGSDVAMFAIKGVSIAETVRLRGSLGGTVKAPLDAVHRTAQVTGRGALPGLLVDDLPSGGVLETPPAPA